MSILETNELFTQVDAWHQRVFGHSCNIEQTLPKMFEEVAELQHAARTGRTDEVLIELIDCMIVLLSLISSIEITHEAFFKMLEKKMVLIEARDQTKRDLERGVHGQSKGKNMLNNSDARRVVTEIMAKHRAKFDRIWKEDLHAWGNK